MHERPSHLDERLFMNRPLSAKVDDPCDSAHGFIPDTRNSRFERGVEGEVGS
jgi:hypothetical protein